MNDVHDRSRQFVMVPYDVIEAISRPIDLAVWVVLKKFANDRGAAHPSRLTLAKLLGLKDGKSVDPSLNRLKKLGLVETFPRWRDASGKIHYSPEGESPSRTTNGYVVYDVPKVGKNPPPPYGESSPTPYGRFSQGVGEKSGQELDPSELDPFELDTPCSPPEGDAPKTDPAASKTAGSTSSRKKPRRRLTDDWEPRPDIRESLAVECPTVDQDHELNLFRDHFIAKDQTSTDWNRNYRSWIRRAKGWQTAKTVKPQKADSIKNTLLGMFDNPQEGKQLEWPNSGQQ